MMMAPVLSKRVVYLVEVQEVGTVSARAYKVLLCMYRITENMRRTFRIFFALETT
jgi:hypothetical protein